MTQKTTLEYSIFDIENPLSGQVPQRTEQYTDRYVYILPATTLKVRNEKIIKFKKNLLSRNGVDIFENRVFPFQLELNEEPRASFLKFHGFDQFLQTTGLVLQKTRETYRFGSCNAYFLRFKFGDSQKTNFTLVGRTEDAIQEARKKLGLGEKNINFGTYLVHYVAEA